MNLHASATIHLHAYISLNMFHDPQHTSALGYWLLLLSSASISCGVPEINPSHVPCSSPRRLTKPFLTRALHLLYYPWVLSFSVRISWSNRAHCQFLLISGHPTFLPRLPQITVLWRGRSGRKWHSFKGNTIRYSQIWALIHDLAQSVRSGARWDHFWRAFEMTASGRHRISMKMSWRCRG